MRQFWLLKSWHREIIINSEGEGHFIHRNKTYETFQVSSLSRVTPLVVILRYQMHKADGKVYKSVLPIFFDMLTDNDYRHLCRMVNNVC